MWGQAGVVACVGPWVSPCPWDVGAVVRGELLGFRAPCTSPGPDSNRAQRLPGDTEQVLWDRGGQGSSRGAPRSLQSRAGLAVTHLAGAEQFGVCCASVTPAGDEYVASFFFIIFFPPLASSSSACVGLLISKSCRVGEAHFSAGSSSSRGSSPSPPSPPLRKRGGSEHPRAGGVPVGSPRAPKSPPVPQVSDGSLTVLSVSREDRGAYTCRAYSIQGEAVHTTRLLVQGRIPAWCLWGHPRCPWGLEGESLSVLCL